MKYIPKLSDTFIVGYVENNTNYVYNGFLTRNMSNIYYDII